ncbi:MAG: glutamate synthase-related protein, partial [Anaerolineae bacterium]|nr:glutamate synthase-related protein [Anaerolineae bacterium]
MVPAGSLEPLPWSPPYIELEANSPADLAEYRPTACATPCRPYTELEADGPEDAPLISGTVVGLRIPLGPQAAEATLEAARRGVAVVHLCADEMGRDTAGRPLPEAIQEVHRALVRAALRDRLTLVVSGGIAAAEHVVKSIACGADLVAIDDILLVAWGCALWADRGRCPVEAGEIPPEWGAQRVMNLMNAWRDQMLEALGAMGMREVRRLRGEIGRTIWHRTEEAAFREALGGSRPRAALPMRKVQTGGEGDFRWPQSLLLATQQQARTGLPPVESEWEYRFGASEGGFDRLAFAFELEMDPAHPPLADPADFDLSLSLNHRDDGRPQVVISVPWYGAGMSYGSISLPVMLARARAAQALNTLVSTGEGGYPEELVPYADHIITQVATGL